MGRKLLYIFTIMHLTSFGLRAQEDETRYIVKMKEGETSNPFTNKIIREANIEYIQDELDDSDLDSRGLNTLGLVVTEGDGYDVEIRLDDHPLVEYYEEERIWEFAGVLDSVDLPSELAVSPWLQDVLGLSTARPDPEQANNAGSSVIVAVIDTGLTTSHPFIDSALSINTAEQGGASGVDDDGNGYVDDIYGANVFNRNGDVTETGTDHGSHVAGIIKTIRDQALATYPDAKKVEVLPIRFIDGNGYGTTAGAVMAMEYAASRGARVINASWGSLGSAAFSQALYDSMVSLYNRDIIMLAAAGNARGGVANNNNAIPYFPASFNIPALLSVGSITPVYSGNVFQRVKLSSFSNYGSTTVHVSAPGSFQESEYFDYGILSMNAKFTNSFDYFIKKKGTSMATPVVAGIAGVIRAINPSLNNYDVRQLIYTNSVYHGDLGSITSHGYVHAANSFTAANSAVTSGSRPAVASPTYFATTGNGRSIASDSASGASGGGGAGGAAGCGMIQLARNNGGNDNDDNPWGGNSMLLVASLYFLLTLLRSSFFKLRRSIG